MVVGWLWTLHVDASGNAAGLFHDGDVYLVTARALAEGVSYRVPSAPRAPPAVRLPPLFPLALSALWRPHPAQVTVARAGTGAHYLVDVPRLDTGVWADARAGWRESVTTHADALTPVYQTPS